MWFSWIFYGNVSLAEGILFPNHYFGYLSSKFRGYRGILFFGGFDSSVGSFVGFDGSFGGYEVGKKR